MRALSALSSLLLLLFLSAHAAGLPATLRIGTDPGYAPFESKAADGRVTGFDIDLMNALCEQMKTHCVVVESPFDALIPSLKARKIDAIMSSMSITPARLQEIDFTEKLYSAKARLIAVRNSPIQPTAAALKGKNIGVLQGSIQETYANKYWRTSGANVVSYPSQEDIYADLITGRLDAAFQDEVAGSFGFLKQTSGSNFAFAGPAVTDALIFGVGVGMGLRKGDEELKQAIDNAFNQLRQDGTWQKLNARYFPFDIY